MASNSFMKIKTRHLSQNQKLVWLIAITPYFINVLIQFLRVPSFVKYIADASWLLLLVTMYVKRKNKLPKEINRLKKAVIIFFLISLLTYIPNFQSPLYYLWGVRNNFRFFVFFFAAVYYFNRKDVDCYLKFLNNFFYVNALVMGVQYLVFGIKQDYLGGLFGVSQGCNSYTNLFFCIILIISYINFVEKKENLFVLLSKITLMLILAAAAELKFFYVEFVILLAIASLITKFSFRKLLILCGAVIVFIIGLRVFVNIFPDIELSVVDLYQYGSSSRGYTNSGDLNRLYFFDVINTKHLTNIFSRLFGLGMGNCDYATGISFLTTPFYNLYGNSHYSWMSTTHMYLENGYIGLVFLFGFFIYIFVMEIKYIKRSNKRYYYYISALCSFAAIMNLIYNNSLRMETGYIIFLMVALPWIVEKGIE